MIALLQFILSNITDHPDDIHIDAITDEITNTQILNVSVHPEDMGKVIGKGGKIITAIRELIRIKAIKLNQKVKVVLLDSDRQSQSQDQINQPDPPQPQA